MLSCGILCMVAQDSFHNPNRFVYIIDCTSDCISDTCVSGMFSMTYDSDSRTSFYTLQYSDGREHKGRVLDKQLEKDRQLFRLQNFFEEKYDADMVIYKSSTDDSQKIAFVYFTNQGEDHSSKKKCIFMILGEYDPVQYEKRDVNPKF